MVCRARAEKIGLRVFVFWRAVPGIASPACPCGQGDQTAARLLAECTDAKSRAMRAMGFFNKGRGVGRTWRPQEGARAAGEIRQRSGRHANLTATTRPGPGAAYLDSTSCNGGFATFATRVFFYPAGTASPCRWHWVEAPHAL